MTRMTGPDCVVMCNLINTYIHAYIHTYIQTYIHTYMHAYIHTYISARNRKIVVDAVRETGDTRVEWEKNVEKKGLVQ